MKFSPAKSQIPSKEKILLPFNFFVLYVDNKNLQKGNTWKLLSLLQTITCGFNMAIEKTTPNAVNDNNDRQILKRKQKQNYWKFGNMVNGSKWLID